MNCTTKHFVDIMKQLKGEMKLRIIKGSKLVRLSELPSGSLFSYKNTIGLKSEYRTITGACESYIVGSGEMFWGGAKIAEGLNHLPVTPLLIVED